MWTFNSIASCAIEHKFMFTWVRGQMKFVWLCVTAMSSSSSSSSFSASVWPNSYTYLHKYTLKNGITYDVALINAVLQKVLCVTPCMAYFLTLSLKASTLLCLCRSASETPAINSLKRSFTESLRWTMASGGSFLTYRNILEKPRVAQWVTWQRLCVQMKHWQ